MTFPTTGAALTPDVVTEYLSTAGDLDADRVVDVVLEVIGTGKMGDNARLTLGYEGAPEGAPRTLVAKLPATDERARAMAGGGGAYFSEVMFYRALASRTSMKTPVI